MGAVREKSAGYITFEEYLARSEDDCRAEWVDGRLEYLMPASLPHQLLCKFLLMILELFVSQKQLGTVMLAPFLMRLPTRPSGREPDILFISNARADQLRRTYLDGPADLAVEIVSPDSEERDRRDKYDEYAVAGIPEFWLIDPDRRTAEFFVLEGAAYRPAQIDADGRFRSTVLPEFWIDVDWLWKRPDPLDVLRTWGILSTDWRRPGAAPR
ncbi:MAG TPA: Uma2 family endonuclease [Chthonomonadaceae bacterium]|nr:Uma2 family endonuclease [Chthonomonadaceae bacterium]